MSDPTDSLREQLAADPDNWEVRYGLIHYLHQEGQTGEAVELLSNIEALPTDDRSIVYAAQCYQVLGANDQAQSVYETALQLNPANEAAKSGLRSLGIEPVAAIPVPPLPDDEPEEIVAVATAAPEKVAEAENKPKPRPRASSALAEVTTPAPKITKDDTSVYDPETVALFEHIHEAEEESKRRYQAAIARDRINSVIVTVLVHVAIVLALGLVIQKVPRRVPPQIVASSSAETNDPALEKQKMQKNTLKATNPSETSAANIVSVPTTSAISMTSLDTITGTDIPVETGMTFQPSMSMGMPSSSNSMMMFGQPMEGETLGVIFDLSDSMAEWLPLVIKEVDRNFTDTPIVFIRNPEVVKHNPKRVDIEVRPVVKEEVVPHRMKDGSWTPFRFLWTHLPKKAPQRSVDRIINTMRSRLNLFIVVGRGDALGEAMKFLAKEQCDSLYVFSDFANDMDPEAALAHGRNMAQQKVRVYIHPPRPPNDDMIAMHTERLGVATQKIAERSKGRALKPLDLIINPPSDEPKPIMVERPTENKLPEISGVSYARPREEIYGKDHYHVRPHKGWTELGRHDCPEFTAVFYGPQAKAYIYMKNRDGQYIQRPITFGYHSRKYHPEIEDPRFRWKTRKFLRNAEPPTFDGKAITWKMILEDEIRFDIFMYIDRRGLNATYVAEKPTDGYGDGAHVGFGFPPLAIERKDIYFGPDLPEGLDLETVREYAGPNVVIFNLPRQNRDRMAAGWARHGFEPGYNTRRFNQLITAFPGGVRTLEVKGPSFGDRVFQARTTSSKIYLGTAARSGDTEPWEGFGARLTRAGDVRERFTKTEAIAFSIEEEVTGGLQPRQ